MRPAAATTLLSRRTETTAASAAAGDANGDEPPALGRARAVATLLDESVRVPGTRFRVGLDPLFGLVPVVGDSLALLGSLYVVLTAVLLGAPWRTVAWMLVLVGLDWVVGSIPLLGTLADAILKVNARNVAVLEDHVRTKG